MAKSTHKASAKPTARTKSEKSAPQNGTRDTRDAAPARPEATPPAPALAPADAIAAPKSAKPAPATTELASMEAALAYLAQRTNVEQIRPASLDAKQVFNLDRMRALLSALGEPQASFKSVHVAGSKGKGSICEMVASCLRACGYTVGLYTSPHLVDIRERVRIGEVQITERDFCVGLSRVAKAAESIAKAHRDATHFELMTALAFVHFAEQAVDIAVIEVGMGGRLDATNVVSPEVCAIAAIQLEHTQILGNTLEKIAAEKAGIMKPGIPCISAPQPANVKATLRAIAEATPCPFLVLGEDVEFSSRFESSPELGPHARVCLNTPRSQFEHLPVPLRGEHQAVNCGVALAILDQLRARGIDTPELRVATGLSQTPGHGRMEMVLRDPRILIDGAHNPESIAGLIKALGAQIRYDSLVVVFGCAADKDVSGMLAKLAMGADKLIFTKAEGSGRACDPRELQRKFAEISPKMTQVAPTVRDAINLAARAVGRDDLLVATGSFAIAGEAKALIEAKFKSPKRPAPGEAQANTPVTPVTPVTPGTPGTPASSVAEVKPVRTEARRPKR